MGRMRENGNEVNREGFLGFEKNIDTTNLQTLVGGLNDFLQLCVGAGVQEEQGRRVSGLS